jgi:hypothetical protein
MSFTRAKPAGWVTLDQLTPAEINQIDTNQSNAIDGAAGGDYTPTNPIGLSNDLEIKSGADLIIESGGKLVANAGSAVELSADLDMLAGADIELGASSEIKTTNARECSMFIPLHIVRKFPTTGSSFGSDIFPANWAYVGADGTLLQHLVSVSTEWVVLSVPMLPPSATITEVQMVIDPVAHATRPAQMPQIRLVRYTSNGTRAVVGTQSDPAADATAYSAQHTVTLTVSESAASRWYVVEICGEYGVDSAPLMELDSVILKYTTTRVNHQHYEVTLA